MVDTPTNQAFVDFSNTQAFVNNSQLIDTPVIKGFDDFMNNVVVGGFDKAMTAGMAIAGDKLSEAAAKGSQVVAEKIDAPSQRAAGDKELARDVSPVIQKEVGTPDISQNTAVTSAVSNAKLDLPTNIKPPVHFEAHEVASAAANTSKQMAYVSQSMTNSEQQALG